MSRETAGNDSPTEALDLLIEQSRRLFEIYDARLSTAETRTAGVVTAAFALATITVTAATAASHANEVLASIVVLCLVLSVLVALLVRSAAGLQPRFRRRHWLRDLFTRLLYENGKHEGKQAPLLSTESDEFRHALEALRDCRGDESPACVKKRVLAVWRARELDSHHMAQAKERGAAVAASLLGVALICAAVLGYLLVVANG